ncbi:MAG: oligosaccharide flippase family protein [bacterium]|nr:oligosaccharide flippase family protein [bacterium]
MHKLIKLLSSKLKISELIILNISYLYVLKFFELLFPLLVMLYVVRILDVGTYGLLALGASLSNYFGILINFGFSISGTQEVATSQHDKTHLNILINEVMSLKLLLASFLIPVFLIIINTFSFFRAEALFYSLFILVIIVQIVSPVWIWAGLEKMKWVAVYGFIGKLLSLVLIIIFVKSKSDYLLIPILSYFPDIVLGVVGLVHIFVGEKLTRVRMTVSNFKHRAFSSFSIFAVDMLMSLQATNTVVLLGFVTNPMVVGYYVAVDKIIRTVTFLFSPILASLFPRISIRAEQSHSGSRLLIQKLVFVMTLILLPICVILAIFAPMIMEVLFGVRYLESILLLRVLSLWPLFNVLFGIYLIHGIVALGKKREILKITLLLFITHLLLIIPIVYVFGIIGLTLFVVIFEAMSLYIIKLQYERLSVQL